MGSRSFRYALALILIVLAAMTIRPCIEYRLYAATTPRPVEVRGSLADYENSAMMKPPMQPLRAQRGRMRAWLCRDCELDPAGIDALGGPGRNGPGVAGARHPACLDPAALGSGQGHPTSVEP
jgi:hypothetical protein